jgi:ribosomal protein S12 methylthiotransferase
VDKLKVGIISLGCDKNRIDSEIILGNIKEKYEVINNPKEAEIIIVNTCGFIESSKQESIDTILEMSEYKLKYKCKVLIVTGCLSQRYGKELLELMPEVDVLLGVNDYDKLNASIDKFINERNKIYYCNFSNENVNNGDRVLSTGNYTAYIRIAEGCNNLCSYCIIPKIRGTYRSRTIEDIFSEVEALGKQGVKEIILVAQDTTKYGIDIYGKKKLPELIKKLSTIESIKWIRILYCYAEEITEELIYEMSENDKVCKYIDIPIQHISDNILKLMKRRGRKAEIISNINKMRETIKNLTIRTTLIVGFPGETEQDFKELKEFVQDMKFDKLGVFKYSQEEGTVAAEMEDQIEANVKEQREEELMLIQQRISKEINESKVGKIYQVLVEGTKGNDWHGRSYEMSPEIDGEIFFKSEKTLKIGDIVEVKILQALEYDLIGVVCYESCQ